MKDILSEIIAHKRIEIELQKQTISSHQLQEQAEIIIRKNIKHRRSMKQALAASSSGIIAEFKRRSPSKGWINKAARAEAIPAAYGNAGAAAISILTDGKFFGGTLHDIRTARPYVDIPILRKDFIIDRYQLLQACIAGADAVLLIAASLSPEQCGMLTTQAHELGLEVLLEIHSPSEISFISKDVDMVGVNNRNLGSFITDVENSFRIAGQLRETDCGPTSPLLVSESGISKPETICLLRAAGFRGFLIGETFMKTEHPDRTLKTFIQEAEQQNIK